MHIMDANQISSAAALNARLPRFCLPTPKRDAERTLAWVNSICILFLLIGLFGSKIDRMVLKAPPKIAEVAPVIVEPLPPPPPATTTEQKQQDTDQDKPEAAQVSVVTLDSPAINFAVPTIGNLVVPNAVAVAPPLEPLKPVASLRSVPTRLESTGGSGERPQPPYPKIALESGQQGSVVLQMTVDEAGLIENIEVKQSSGSSVLDHSALDFVKRHWIVPPGKGTRAYEATIIYQLKRNE